MSKQTGLRAGDPYGGRQPTSHERHAGQPWDVSYRDGPAPWDIRAPQPAVVRLASAGVFGGVVLDAGCGTGENALHIAARGLHILGVDVAETAVSIARDGAAARGIDAEFIVADALNLDRLDRVFDTVLDCALFHAFDNAERRDYVASLASVTRPGAYLYLLCFSDVDPETAGPHPVSRHELSAPFTPGSGWSITSVSLDRLQTRFAPEGAPAWLAKLERIEPYD
ncbi:MAG: class I SAM-dependent methyltransferase [Actinomycetota bacterium]|nr:class I SAM-dependent methyltransferase [Actinomycetota bacterium]